MNNYDFLYDQAIFDMDKVRPFEGSHKRYRHTPNSETYYKEEQIPSHQLKEGNYNYGGGYRNGFNDFSIKHKRADINKKLKKYTWLQRLRWKIEYNVRSIFNEFIIQIGMLALFLLLAYYMVT